MQYKWIPVFHKEKLKLPVPSQCGVMGENENIDGLVQDCSTDIVYVS